MNGSPVRFEPVECETKTANVVRLQPRRGEITVQPGTCFTFQTGHILYTLSRLSPAGQSKQDEPRRGGTRCCRCSRSAAPPGLIPFLDPTQALRPGLP